ncbi:hypothetical protein ACHAW6_007390 [Cyclotella cf. meneghiniana]
MTISSGSLSASNDPPLIDQEASLLLARLQSQFGDLNVSSFLNGSTSSCNEGDSIHNEEEDDDSSYEEPTAEELAAWQEAQFQNGRIKLQAEKNSTSTATEARRQKYQQRPADDASATYSTIPDLGEETSTFFPPPPAPAAIHPLLRTLVEADPEILGTTWKNLYSSSDGDGLSFRTLDERIRGYAGPTLMLFGGAPSPSHRLASVAADEGRRVSLGCFFGGECVWTGDSFRSFVIDRPDCFLFGLDYDAGNVTILRPKARSTESIQTTSCRPSSSSSVGARSDKETVNGSTTLLQGIQIGGNASMSSSYRQPKLHISESFEQCRALQYDATFEEGDVLLGKCDDSLYYFDVDCVEVWGVGGHDVIEEALAAREKERGVRSACLERARKVVDKRPFLEDFENGLVWSRASSGVGGEGGLFGHAGFVQERDV